MKRFVISVAVLLLSGCMPTYTLVKPGPVAVAKGTFKVQPSSPWNRAPATALDIPQEENWTQNGPLLDLITFIGGLQDGQVIAKQRAKDDQKVPVFCSNMTPQDLVSVIESFYRIKTSTTVFEVTSVNPTSFLGSSAIALDFRYIGGDEVKRRGRALISVIDRMLYMMVLDVAALHYFDAALPEFSRMSGNAVRS